MKIQGPSPKRHFKRIQSNPRKRKGFTLIELLVVITIIAVLAGLAIPAGNRVIKRARMLKASAQMNAIEAAIRNYHQEYSRYPLATQGGADLEFTSSDTGGNQGFMSALMGENPAGNAGGVPNPRLTSFIEPDYSDGGAGGIDPMDTTDFAWNDPWGNPYFIIIDSNYDKKITDPSGSGTDLRKSVLLISAGPENANTAPTDIATAIGTAAAPVRDVIFSWKN